MLGNTIVGSQSFAAASQVSLHNVSYRCCKGGVIPVSADDKTTQPTAARVVVFHDNFAQMGGAERVAEELHRSFPGAALATTLSVTERLTSYLQQAKIATTWMQWLPAKAKLFRWYFLLYPFAIEGVDLSSYDLVVTSCFGYAKGVKRRKSAVHICYCHTPMRWVWRTSDYLAREKFGRVSRFLLSLALGPLKAWEIRAAKQPDFYVANSKAVAGRLKAAFGIEAPVIPPPIETRRFNLSSEVEDYYLILSRLVPYKRIDLAVQACSISGRRLLVIGGGPDERRLKSMAGPTVEFLGRQPDEAVARLVSRCRALLFTGEEDFGMAPLEVNAAGRPVIAFRGGGATETIVPALNGLFFDDPSAESLLEALTRFEQMHWNSTKIRAYAEGFDTEVFRARIRAFVEEHVPQLRNRLGNASTPIASYHVQSTRPIMQQSPP